ncbi:MULTISPECIES: hypothetical protein [Flavobacterium]|uniref:Uncharacterized protein n=2 Tax=Flavobacterium TaxID=237 RepID=A0A444VZC4_9FLAO|nr:MULTISPECIES: hypothetical protein [Flavobacterium]AXB57729.1 hypothetical protein HYN86_14440 [Flavobacterium fluviale]MXO04379.1 hypothetical protein [Flavobacterium sp. HBTb2-11-1]RYJ38923.1 hypothetical protein NU08_2148 [Flavobacterium anhuiense]
MITKNEVSKVYDTVLSIPGMNEMVKIDLRISRKNVLLLCRLIEQGLLAEKDAASLIGILSNESVNELRNFSDDCLQKSGLVELNQKLLELSAGLKD